MQVEPSSCWTRDERTAAHLVAVALWMLEQAEPFTFEDLRQAFPGAYVGTFDAVDRKWTRHKRALASLGVALSLEGADGYSVARSPRPAEKVMRCAAALVASLRAPPSTSAAEERELDEALRKLIVYGTPIVEVLRKRSLSPPAVSRGLGAIGIARACLNLLNVLLIRGDEGLSEADAAACSGALSPRDLSSVLKVLTEVTVPLDAPLDSTGVEFCGGQLSAYLRLRSPRPLALTPVERAALSRAGLAGVSAPLVDVLH